MSVEGGDEERGTGEGQGGENTSRSRAPKLTKYHKRTYELLPHSRDIISNWRLRIFVTKHLCFWLASVESSTENRSERLWRFTVRKPGIAWIPPIIVASMPTWNSHIEMIEQARRAFQCVRIESWYLISAILVAIIDIKNFSSFQSQPKQRNNL